jgi:hypothetical protein
LTRLPGPTTGDQLHPGHPPLRGLHRIEPQVVAQLDREAADLADRLGAAVEEVGVLLDEEPRALGTAGFLIGHVGDDDVARRLAALASPLADHRQRHRVHVLHVDGAATPEAAVLDLAAERIDAPVVRVGRDDIEVAVNEQRTATLILAGHPGDDARAALVRLVDLRLEPDLGQLLGDVFGGLALVAGRVRAVDPDQVAAQVDDFVLGARLLDVGHDDSSGCGGTIPIRTTTPSCLLLAPAGSHGRGKSELGSWYGVRRSCDAGLHVRVAELADALA